MRIPEDKIKKYIGNETSGLEGKVSEQTLKKLKEFERTTLGDDFSVIDYLFLEHQLNNRSLKELVEETDISYRIITKIFDIYKLPKLTQAEAVRQNWEDPEFRKRHAEAVRQELYERWKDPEFRKRHAEAVRQELYERWKDPEFRKRHAEATRQELYERWKDPEFRKRHAEATRQELYERWKDPEFRKRHAEATRQNWEDPEFRKRNAEAVRQELYERWKDPEFRKRNAEAVRQNWEDPEFRKRNAEAVRQNWEDPEFRKRHAEAVRQARLSNIPKIKGYRKDIQRNAETTAEANLARIIIYCGRKELKKRNRYLLNIQENYASLFKSARTNETLDFLVEDPRGNLIGYKILPKPQQKSYARAEMLSQQYNIELRIITEEKYKRLEQRFKRKIENDQRFSGWETKEDNLGTNAERYNQTVIN